MADHAQIFSSYHYSTFPSWFLSPLAFIFLDSFDNCTSMVWLLLFPKTLSSLNLQSPRNWVHNFIAFLSSQKKTLNNLNITGTLPERKVGFAGQKCQVLRQRGSVSITQSSDILLRRSAFDRIRNGKHIIIIISCSWLHCIEEILLLMTGNQEVLSQEFLPFSCVGIGWYTSWKWIFHNECTFEWEDWRQILCITSFSHPFVWLSYQFVLLHQNHKSMQNSDHKLHQTFVLII